MRRFWLLSVLIAIIIGANAQDQGRPFKRIVKFYPFQLYRIFPCATFAYEDRVANNISLTGEASSFLNLDILKSDYHSKRGLRLRGELRYYFNYKYSASNSRYTRGMYAATEVQMTSARYKEFSVDVKWRESGYGFKVGMAEYLNRITLDYSLGVLWRHTRDTPPDLWASMFNFWKERNPIVQPTISFGIGYKL